MQLKKQAIRNTPNFDEKKAPHGMKRSAHDYNQKKNNQQRNRNARGDLF